MLARVLERTQIKEITKPELAKIKKKAMRQGVWFKLEPLKRLTIDISLKILKVIRSSFILNIVDEILDMLNPIRKFLKEAWDIGSQLVKIRVNQAIMLGNKKAKKWLKDKDYILALGISYLNTPKIYRLRI